jgi:predicted house-cleaning NTP pyrophosphatase (Maf/HAM1 superfamily)
MPYLLVDDGDGRVLAEFEDGGQALRFLERFSRHASDVADGVCVVRVEERVGGMTAVSTSTTLRTLSELPGVPGVPDLRR